MEERERAEARPTAEVSQVARDAHAAAAGKPLRKRANPRTAPREDLSGAIGRMEQSILNARKARAHCGICGAQGRWKTDSVKKPLRYLICVGCGVGRTQIAVTAEDVRVALKLQTPDEDVAAIMGLTAEAK